MRLKFSVYLSLVLPLGLFASALDLPEAEEIETHLLAYEKAKTALSPLLLKIAREEQERIDRVLQEQFVITDQASILQEENTDLRAKAASGKYSSKEVETMVQRISQIYHGLLNQRERYTRNILLTRRDTSAAAAPYLLVKALDSEIERLNTMKAFREAKNSATKEATEKLLLQLAVRTDSALFVLENARGELLQGVIEVNNELKRLQTPNFAKRLTNSIQHVEKLEHQILALGKFEERLKQQFDLGVQDQQQVADAYASFELCTKLPPNDAQAKANLGLLLKNCKQIEGLRIKAVVPYFAARDVAGMKGYLQAHLDRVTPSQDAPIEPTPNGTGFMILAYGESDRNGLLAEFEGLRKLARDVGAHSALPNFTLSPEDLDLVATQKKKFLNP